MSDLERRLERLEELYMAREEATLELILFVRDGHVWALERLQRCDPNSRILVLFRETQQRALAWREQRSMVVQESGTC